MIQGLDNKTLFAALSNLRLAPHVREGRGVRGASSVEAEPSSRTTTTPSAVPVSPVPASTEEKLSLSPQALSAYRDASGTAAQTGPVGDSRAAAPAPSAPGARAEETQPRELEPRDREVPAHGQDHRKAAAAAAYQESAASTVGSGPDTGRAAPTRGPLYA